MSGQVTLQDGRGQFGVLLRANDDLTQVYALLFDPVGQRVTITMHPQPLDPFWASLTEAKTPPPQIDGPNLVERPLTIEVGKALRFEIVFDGSLIEAFVNGRVSLSYRVYGGVDQPIGLFSQDTSVSFTDLMRSSLTETRLGSR
jgi:beta-fructofuranosidase